MLISEAFRKTNKNGKVVFTLFGKVITAIEILAIFSAPVVLAGCSYQPKTAEEMEAEEIEKLKEYYSKYKDRYALFQIYEKFRGEDGFISASGLMELEIVLADIDTRGWETAVNHSDYFFCLMLDQSYEKVLNGWGEDLTREDVEFVINDVYAAAELGSVNISTLNPQTSSDRVEQGIIMMEEYFINPTNQNLKAVEKLFFSKEVLPGEIILMDAWYTCSPNSIVENTNQDWDIVTEKAFADLLEANRTKNVSENEIGNEMTPQKIYELTGDTQIY